MRAHHKHGTLGVFLADILGRSIQPYDIIHSALINHSLQHILPLSLTEYVKSPVRHLPTHLLPHLYKPVKALLIVKSANRNNSLCRTIRIFFSDKVCGIGNHPDSRHCAPHLLILLCQDDEAVKLPDQPLIHS